MQDAAIILLFTFCLLAPLIALLRWRMSRVSRRIRSFLGVKAKEEIAIVSGQKFSPIHEVDLMRALEMGLAAQGFTVTREGLCAMGGQMEGPITFASMLNDTFQHGFGSVQRQRRQTGPDVHTELFAGALCLCEKDGHRLALMLMRGENMFQPENYLDLAVADRPEERDFARTALEALETWVTENSIYKGHALVPALEALGALKLEFADVSLPPGIVLEDRLVEDLESNFLAFVQHRDTLRKMSVPVRRGLLLLGPPGSGKTSTCRYLRSRLPEHSFFVVPSEGIAQVRGLFQAARSLAPSVIVIEDVDLALRTPSPDFPNPPMKDLLNELDGLQDREDVMVVLTSNSKIQLEQALADRPGRIDHTIRYEPPGPTHRKAVLASYIRDMKVSVGLEELSNMCDGLTPAAMFEVVKKAAVRAVRRAGTSGVPELGTLDFRAALEELNNARTGKDSRVRPFPVS